MKLIVGLGNPGSPYSKTRHNIGRRLVERLGENYRPRWKADPNFHSHWTEVREKNTPIILATPDTFMNESGKAVGLFIPHFKINFQSDLLIVVDDVAIPFGKLRLRASGQDGGHKGLRSVEKMLGSKSYARLRIGIGRRADELNVPPDAGATHASPLTLEKYVLRPFSSKEERELKSILERAAHACLLWATSSVEMAMDWANKPL